MRTEKINKNTHTYTYTIQTCIELFHIAVQLHLILLVRNFDNNTDNGRDDDADDDDSCFTSI